MSADRGNPFSGAWLERRSEARAAPDWAARALADPDTRFLMASGTRHLVQRHPRTALAFLAGDHPLVRGSDPERWMLLGWFQGACCVLIAPTPAPGPAELPDGAYFEELRALLADLPPAETAVLACARALLVWQARHRHCGVCGAPTLFRSAGHCLQCTSTACGAEFFPRIDPAVIVVVSDGDRALLGRQPSWPPGRYSALAGFVEPGETLEDTVVREVQEEAGVRVRGVRYIASQAWPFPSSLMLGFLATADSREPLRLDDELEDARWFSAAELSQAGSRLLPPPYTIARRLLDAWYLETTGTAFPARS